MKIKFNKFERVAGLFVVLAIAGVFVSAFTVAVRQGWFEKKIPYTTFFASADGLHQGSPILVAGLKAGSVDEVELMSNNTIRVHFHVLGRFQKRIKEDSQTQLIRPFILGDRAVEVTVGSEESPLALANYEIPSIETFDLMSLMSGKNVNQYFQRVSGLIDNLSLLVDAFANKKRAQLFIDMFDKIDPLLVNLNQMSMEVVMLSKQATHNGQLKSLLGEATHTMMEMNKILPGINNKDPNFGENIATLTQNISAVSEEMKILAPALKEIQPELPHAGRRLIEVLDETVVTLRAMQKTFFLRSNVEEVLAEEKARGSKNRLPAQSK